MGYELLTTTSARRSLKRLPRQIRQHIIQVAQKIGIDPFQAKQLDRPWTFLRSWHTVYRRTHYRLVYEVDKRHQRVFIHFVGTRERFYKQLMRLKLKPHALNQ